MSAVVSMLAKPEETSHWAEVLQRGSEETGSVRQQYICHSSRRY